MTLRKAVDTVIKLGDINLADHQRWANTYNSTPEAVAEAINVALTLRARETEGEGK